MSEMGKCEKCWSEVCDQVRNDLVVIGLLARKIRNGSEEDFLKKFSEEQIQRVASIEEHLRDKWNDLLFMKDPAPILREIEPMDGSKRSRHSRKPYPACFKTSFKAVS
jgi:hypothetical protein